MASGHQLPTYVTNALCDLQKETREKNFSETRCGCKEIKKSIIPNANICGGDCRKFSLSLIVPVCSRTSLVEEPNRGETDGKS